MRKIMNVLNKNKEELINAFLSAGKSIGAGYEISLYLILNTSLLGMIFFSKISNIFLYLYFIFFILYALIYIWRELPFTFISFICFFINFSLFIVFIYGIFRLYQGFSNPIYMEHLSLFSYYRYTAFLTITVLGLIIYLRFRNYASMSYIIINFNYPYLKEETRKILFTWDATFMGNLCFKLLDLLIIPKNQNFYFFFHFLIFYGFRLIQTSIFCNFVFFHGDLRLNLYLLPISFLTWLLRFLDYYFYKYFEFQRNYLYSIFHVTAKQNALNDEDFVYSQLSDLSYQVTPYGLSQGFSCDDITKRILFSQWLEYVNLFVYFIKYKKKINIFSGILLSINATCWSYIFFYFPLESSLAYAPLWSGFRRPLTYTPPMRALHGRHNFQHRLKEATGGQHSPGHPVYGDIDTQGNFVALGSLSHGLGTLQNSGVPIGQETPDAKETKAYPFSTPQIIPKEALKNKLGNTEEFLNRHDVKAKLEAASGSKDNP